MLSLVYSACLESQLTAPLNSTQARTMRRKKSQLNETIRLVRKLKTPYKVVTQLENELFGASGGEAGLRCFAVTLEHLSDVFSVYIPTHQDKVSVIDTGPGLPQLVQPVTSKKGLRLLQVNPFFAKDMFNFNFLFKYVTTRFNLNRGAFFKQGSLATDYLFRDGLSATAGELNLNPAPAFSYEIRRRLVKSFAVSRFTPKVTPWYLTNLVRFIEHCSGRKVSVKLNPFLVNSLTFTDRAKCQTWIGRIASFQRLLGPKFFLDEVLLAMMIALKAKDATFLSNWIRGMLKRLSF